MSTGTANNTDAPPPPPPAPASASALPAPVTSAATGAPARPQAADASTRAGAPAEHTSWLYRTLRVFCHVMSVILFDLKVYGHRNIPETGGVLLLANHQSYLDPILLGVRIKRPVSFLAKSELFENRYFGWLIRNLNAFPVRQGRGDKGAIEETIRRLREGHVLNVFPEGSRSEDGQIGPIQSGASLIVRRAQVPIVPIAIDGSFRAWPKWRKVFRPHRVRVMYGKPMVVHHLKAAEITRVVDGTLRRMFAELREVERKERWP